MSYYVGFESRADQNTHIVYKIEVLKAGWVKMVNKFLYEMFKNYVCWTRVKTDCIFIKNKKKSLSLDLYMSCHLIVRQGLWLEKRRSVCIYALLFYSTQEFQLKKWVHKFKNSHIQKREIMNMSINDFERVQGVVTVNEVIFLCFLHNKIMSLVHIND